MLAWFSWGNKKSISVLTLFCRPSSRSRTSILFFGFNSDVNVLCTIERETLEIIAWWSTTRDCEITQHLDQWTKLYFTERSSDHAPYSNGLDRLWQAKNDEEGLWLTWGYDRARKEREGHFNQQESLHSSLKDVYSWKKLEERGLSYAKLREQLRSGFKKNL